MKESRELKKKRLSKVVQILEKTYLDLRCALHFESPFQLLVATILSAQCTDKRVNMVTPELFKQFPDAEAMSCATQAQVERLIQSTGFYKNKARNILGAARAILEHHHGKVPAILEELVKLPGVGRKTANVVLGYAYGIPGLTVDTHMIRLNQRLGFTKHQDPVKIEFELMELVPQKEWTRYSTMIIFHGRNRCFARKPDCAHCEIQKLCPSTFLTSK